MGFLDNAGVDRVWKKFKNTLSNYLPLTGGTMKGLLTVPYGTVVHHTYGTQDSAGYVRLATIVIKGEYTISPTELTITRRGDSNPTKIVVCFNGVNSNDPSVGTFSVFGETADIWLYKSAVSTWELYVKKIWARDKVSVIEYHNPTYPKITVTWQEDQISTLPDGAVKATVGKFLGVASKSTGVVDYNNKDAIVKIGYSGSSLDSSKLAYLAGYTADSKIKNVSKDAVKSYLGIGKYDTEYNWKSKDPVLLLGEIAISYHSTSLLNEFKYKVGDGTSKWSELPYAYTNGITLPTSGKTNKKKWIKFATVDLHELGAWEGCSGLFKLFQTESQGAIGMLKFQFRNGSTAGKIERGNLIWVSLNSPDYANSVCAVSTGDGTRDLYYRPIFDYDTTSIVATDVYNPRRITMQSDNTYVANVTPVTTSYVSSYASSAKSASEVNGHTVDADVPSNAKFTDTTYTEFQGTDGTSDGAPGLVPAPKKSEFGNSYSLGSDGTWRDFGQTFVSQSFAEEAYATNKALENAIKELKKYVDQQSPGGVTLDSVYPIGSVYISANGANPNAIIGGTWEEFATGRTLIGYDPSDDDLTETGMTGGEKTHALTVDELPEHNHDVTVDNKELTGSVWNFAGQGATFGPGNSTSGVFSKGGDGTCFYPSSTGKATGVNDGFTLDATHDHTATSGNTGSGTAHNNMMPYITVRMWKRTA